MTFRRFSKNDEGCYVVKAINSIGSDTKSWNILVATESRNIRTNNNSYQDAIKESQIIHDEGKRFTSSNNSIQEGIKVNHVYVFFGIKQKIIRRVECEWYTFLEDQPSVTCSKLVHVRENTL